MADRDVPQPERFARLPAAPSPVTFESAPGFVAEGAVTSEEEWAPSDGSEMHPRPEARLAPWALLAAVVALVASFFVGWGIPLGLIAVIAAILSLRCPPESRGLAVWALVLALVSCVYSLGWLAWAIFGAALFSG